MAGQSAILKEFLQNYKGSNVFFTIAGISGALAIALAAYGNHSSALNDPANAQFKKKFDIAVHYHFLHNIVLLALPLMRRPVLVGCLMVSGQLLFCGSIYLSALTMNRNIFNPAPYGGFLLMAAWLAIAF